MKYDSNELTIKQLAEIKDSLVRCMGKRPNSVGINVGVTNFGSPEKTNVGFRITVFYPDYPNTENGENCEGFGSTDINVAIKAAKRFIKKEYK